MRQSTRVQVAEAAAFALFEAFKAPDLALSPRVAARARFERAADAAVVGLPWAEAGESSLFLRFDAAGALPDGVWLHAGGARGPAIAAYFDRERPAIECRFATTGFAPLGGGLYLLRERVLARSHDGRQDERLDLLTEGARRLGVPLSDGWLHIGVWDSLEGHWEPQAPGRLLAVACLCRAVADLDPRGIPV